MNITLDGTTYDLPFKAVDEDAEILFKDGAGRTEDGVLHAEAIGTYYNFGVQVGMSRANASTYAAFYLAISEPTASHTITLPHPGSNLTFGCYFAQIKHQVMRWSEGGTNYFKNLSFRVIATSPARTPS